MRRRVVVVGGGLAGLWAAICAVRAGAHVELLEGRAEPGGRARTREEHGFRFNLGPHALYRASEAARELARLGVEVSGVCPPVSGALAWRGGRVLALPVRGTTLLASRLLPLRAKLELGRWLAALPRLDTSGLDAVPLDRALADSLHHRENRALVTALVRLTSYVHAPGLHSAGAALAQLRAAQAGVLYLDGGWDQLVDRLAARARESGVRVQLRTRVRQLEERGGSYALECADGQRLECDAVVLALGPAEIRTLLPAGSDPALWERAERSLPVRVAALDLGLDGLPRPRHRFALGIDEPSYCSVHSIARGLAPEGGAQLQLVRYLALDEKITREELERELGGLLDALQPGWRERALTQRWMTELRVAHALPTAQGRGLAGRPPVACPQRPGLFLAGDWVGPRGQLADACFASGRQAGEGAARGD